MVPDIRLVFYIVLKARMNLMAVNLPSLWHFTAGSPRDVLRSVLSILSLLSARGSQTSFGSNRSRAKGQTPGKNSLQHHPSLDTSTSQAELTELHAKEVACPEGKSVEASALKIIPQSESSGLRMMRSQEMVFRSLVQSVRQRSMPES